MVEHESLAII